MENIQEQKIDIFTDPSRNCADAPGVTFYPEDAIGEERARRLCKGCPVLEQCLEYALVNGVKEGVWGGATESERVILRKK